MELRVRVDNKFAMGVPGPEQVGVPKEALFSNGADYSVLYIRLDGDKILAGRDFCGWLHYVEPDGCNHIIIQCPHCGAWGVHRHCEQCGKDPQDETEFREYRMDEFPIDIF